MLFPDELYELVKELDTSTKINKNRFIEILKKLIRQEIDEASTSANVPGYMTIC